MQKISVLGCGRWGSFIAWYLATKKGKEVYSWGPEEDYSYQVLKNTGKNEYVTLDERITLTCDLAAAVSRAELLPPPRGSRMPYLESYAKSACDGRQSFAISS